VVAADILEECNVKIDKRVALKGSFWDGDGGSVRVGVVWRLRHVELLKGTSEVIDLLRKVFISVSLKPLKIPIDATPARPQITAVKAVLVINAPRTCPHKSDTQVWFDRKKHCNLLVLPYNVVITIAKKRINKSRKLAKIIFEMVR
jgi:hypothetical protein